MRQFVEHARETNDIFILAAKLLVRVALAADAALAAGTGKAPDTGPGGPAAMAALAAAWWGGAG
jgi:hypothetical protein